ncbi:hypothetical protein SKAU_G00122730 [Synaphobranchus kaupii]|uniref:Uncharacterized protein n=1 Tax=Synaphobranchus kaupii TaxID=118154 RepID=A0A9Q1FP01_SYNKA|nr:hypothetical protein SKAU_G00122730 [Synaphobranchus kaupii]
MQSRWKLPPQKQIGFYSLVQTEWAEPDGDHSPVHPARHPTAHSHCGIRSCTEKADRTGRGEELNCNAEPRSPVCGSCSCRAWREREERRRGNPRQRASDSS